MDSKQRNYFNRRFMENFIKNWIANIEYSFMKTYRFNSTSLSKLIWELKDCKNSYKIDRKIRSHARSYKIYDAKYNFCIDELYEILTSKKKLLNERRESVPSYTYYFK